MKEQIIKILEKFNAPCKYGITSSDVSLAAAELEFLINQEVEKRIAERMPSEDEAMQNALHGFRNVADFMDGFKWLRCRLTKDGADRYCDSLEKEMWRDIQNKERDDK